MTENCEILLEDNDKIKCSKADVDILIEKLKKAEGSGIDIAALLNKLSKITYLEINSEVIYEHKPLCKE